MDDKCDKPCTGDSCDKKEKCCKLSKKCSWCEESFQPSSKVQKFCGKVCYRRHHSKRTSSRNNAQRSESGRYVFRHIKDRCNNPKSKAYASYGALGIKCEFESTKSFVKWYNLSNDCANCGIETDTKNKVSADNGKQVDRINASGPYSEDNCRILCRACNQYLSHQ